MHIIYPINGRNERLGELFRTPKHLLLYRGVPAIKQSMDYMRKLFTYANIVALANQRLNPKLIPADAVIETPDTASQVETLLTYQVPGPVMFVDCDIVPVRINKPVGNTVYLFKNELWMKQYSNFQVEDSQVVDCNEKGEFFPYAGAGIYYFERAEDFYSNSDGCTTIAQVIKKLLPFGADLTNEVFRFGTLNDIKNDYQLV